MTELFFSDGHLTDEALQGLIDGNLDELSRLEVGEHLSFCDTCLDRYTALLTGDVLEEPEIHQTLPVMRQIRTRQANTAVRRYATAVAAVAIGSFLWYTGIFQNFSEGMTRGTDWIDPPAVTETEAEAEEAHQPSLSSRILKAVDDWSNRVRDAAAPALQVPSRGDTTLKQTQNNAIEENT